MKRITHNLWLNAEAKALGICSEDVVAQEKPTKLRKSGIGSKGVNEAIEKLLSNPKVVDLIEKCNKEYKDNNDWEFIA